MITVEAALEKVQEAARDGRLAASSASGIARWLSEPPFGPYRSTLLQEIVDGRWKQLDDAFFAVLEFGTGGRRGIMYPVGTNALNARTIAESARGLADYINGKKAPGTTCSCVIARDTRHNSPEFAELCARVLAAAGVKVYLFQEQRSTPLLSFAVRHLRCSAGIMITASHNPPSDNGFKCYDANGGQVVPPDDSGIIDCVKAASDREIPEMSLEEGLRNGSIVPAGAEVDKAYIEAVVGESVSHARGISIVYTPLHGVGETSVAAALKADGFANVNILASQRTPDGDFRNVPKHVSNPENPETLEAAIAEAKATGADLVLASDPDADRIGVGLPVTGDPTGEWTTLDGNQIGVLLAAFVMKQYADLGKLRPDHYLVTTLVSTQMAKALARREGIRTEDDLLVGFKWIAQRIDRDGPAGFLFGFEESHGYLKGTYARDKDASVASMLFAELTATVNDRKQTVVEYLDDLYIDVGHYGERLVNKTYKGREGLETIRSLMKAFRTNPPRTIAGLAVTEVLDYGTHEIRNLRPLRLVIDKHTIFDSIKSAFETEVRKRYPEAGKIELHIDRDRIDVIMDGVAMDPAELGRISAQAAKHEIFQKMKAVHPLPEPSGDVLIFHTERDGVRFAARPSGTEPKIKFYLFARSHVDGPDSLPAAKAETARRLDQMVADIEAYVAGVA